MKPKILLRRCPFKAFLYEEGIYKNQKGETDKGEDFFKGIYRLVNEVPGGFDI